MPKHHELMQLHVEALFTHGASGDLVRVNEPDGWALRYRYDVDYGTREALEAAAHDDLRHESPRYSAP